ncbi:MAG: LPS export ABC transporter periplasmic protein LptC [Alphaproteobacteria bacterium]
MTVSEPGSDNAAPPGAADNNGRSFAQLSFRRQRPAYNPLYGRFVGITKVLLPTIATAIIALVVIWPELNEQENRFRLGPAHIDRSDAENLRMVNARFTGADASKRYYTITADSADQANADSVVIALDAPKADIELSNGAWVALTAVAGSFNRDRQILELSGGVNLFHDSGYEFRTESAFIDLAAGDATGVEPIAGQGPFGQLQAEGFHIYNRGERVVFTGKSRLTLIPKSTDGS